MALRPCLRCGVLVERGSYCAAHQPVGFYVRPSPSSRDRPSQRLTARVRQRDGHRCANCGATDSLQVHHLNAVADGGQHTPANLVTCAPPAAAAPQSGRPAA